MAYARFSDGDVYVFSTGAQIYCQLCKLTALEHPDAGEAPKNATDFTLALFAIRKASSVAGVHGDFVTTKREEMIEHLQEHVKAGDDVPPDAIERLKHESANGDPL